MYLAEFSWLNPDVALFPVISEEQVTLGSL